MIRFKYVTITGIDEDTDMSRIVYLSRKYPFVEWGILISATRSGNSKRYPSLTWINHLFALFDEENVAPNISLHICGKLAHTLFAGKFDTEWTSFVPNVHQNLTKYRFKRMQINVNMGRMKRYYPNEFCDLMRKRYPWVDVIIQHNHYNHSIWRDLINYGYHSHVLFDASGGHGIFPTKIQSPLTGMFCGYAGGLGPHNVLEFSDKLNTQLESGITWIDMESGVRDGDGYMDLDRVEDVLDACKHYALDYQQFWS